MAKFVSLFVFILIAALIQATPLPQQIQDIPIPKPEEGILGNFIFGHDAKITEEHFEIDVIGNYNFGYKQNDLQAREESGKVDIDPKTSNYTLDSVVGYYRYFRPDGLWQIVEYRADRNGFIPRIRTEKYVSGQFPEVEPIRKFTIAYNDDDDDDDLGGELV